MSASLTVSILGGPDDGFTGRIAVPANIAVVPILTRDDITYRIHRADGRTWLVHPDAQAWVWPVDR